MKNAIIFASKKGGTEKVSKWIQNKLGTENSVLIDLVKDHEPDLNPYETCIIGGPVYAGNLYEPVKKFLDQNSSKLIEKRIGLFICGMNEAKKDAQLERAFPEALRHHAIATAYLGGEFDFKKLNWFERFLVKRITGTRASVEDYKNEALDKFAKKLSTH